MRLVRLDIRNFRLLRDASVRMDETQTTTILVGPNNSGKTSVAEALLLFTEGNGKDFSIYDLSVCCWAAFAATEKAMLVDASGPEIALIPPLPSMSMDLHFLYGIGDADLAVASDLLMDVDAESFRVRLRIAYVVKDIEKLTKEFRETRREGETLFTFLGTRMKEHYGLVLYKVAPDDSESERIEDHKILDRLIKVNFVFAQRHIDDQEHSRATRLSHLLHAHYEKHYKTAEPEDHRQIEDSLKAYAVTLGGRYMKAFDGLIGNLLQFGYPQRRAPSISIKAELSAATLFHDNTRIWYGPAIEAALAGASPEDAAASLAPAYELPEKYNGLGFKNLIYMILQIQSFRIAVTRMPEDRPRVHVVFIEEPETHLHPQVQSVFIGQLSAFLTRDGEGADVQVVLTTHSSHVVADSGFAPIRYFRRRDSHIEVRDLLEFGKGSLPPDALRFLTRYLSLMRCDLFFADKVILVEGQVEKLLLPKMIADCAAKGHPAFASEYITIMEVGGAHAHKFRSLLKFIEVPTLVITDLDAVGADGRMCRVADGTRTSNATLKSWLPGKIALNDVLAAVAADKTDGTVRIAYQIAEDSTLPCARTFEEAFIYCNADWLIRCASGLPVTASTVARSCAADLVRDAYDIQPAKVDFALDLMVTEGWETPRGWVRGSAVIDADVEIRRCIDDRKSFLVDAGAGSGKTSSLVDALRHLIDTQLGAALAQNSQRIACITFTNVAKDQVVERTARNPLIQVSTVHDFLWSVIKPHQKALKRALLRHNRELKGTSARKRDEAALEAALPGVSVTYSDRGAEFLEGRLFHDDLIEVAARVFEDNALMAQIVGARFPFIFVDEYQDTSRLVIGILDRVMTAARGKAVVGYFGDKLQHIYDGGVGEIPADRRGNLVHIQKAENYRCSKAVIAVLNRIRTDIEQYPSGKNVDGSAVYLRLSRRGADDDVLARARVIVQKKLNWDLSAGEQKELLLTHRLIARKAGYDALLAAYNERGSFSRDALVKGEDTIIRFFQANVEPLIAMWRAGKTGKVLSLLRAGGFTLKDNPGKARTKEAMDRLTSMAAQSTVREVLTYLDSAELLVLLDDLKKGLAFPATDDSATNEVLDERQVAERTFYRSLLALPYVEVSSFCTFLEEHTPFSTHHGVKGDEFDTVLRARPHWPENPG